MQKQNALYSVLLLVLLIPQNLWAGGAGQATQDRSTEVFETVYGAPSDERYAERDLQIVSEFNASLRDLSQDDSKVRELFVQWLDSSEFGEIQYRSRAHFYKQERIDSPELSQLNFELLGAQLFHGASDPQSCLRIHRSMTLMALMCTEKSCLGTRKKENLLVLYLANNYSLPGNGSYDSVLPCAKGLNVRMKPTLDVIFSEMENTVSRDSSYSSSGHFPKKGRVVHYPLPFTSRSNTDRSRNAPWVSIQFTNQELRINQPIVEVFWHPNEFSAPTMNSFDVTRSYFNNFAPVLSLEKVEEE